MRFLAWVVAVSLLALSSSKAEALGRKPRINLEALNQKLCGQVVDHTCNHGHDLRIWSTALCQRRDLYVYLPPGFDPKQQYPLVILLHGLSQDEHFFLEDLAIPFDRAIACGDLPPVIIAVPDGSLQGKPTLFHSASFFANTAAGNFEDFVVVDVLEFVTRTYPIRPEKEAHALIGISMGGTGAFNIGIKYRECFKVVMGYMPAVNLRWVDCRQHYKGNFDPHCWDWRSRERRWEVVGRFYGVVTVRYKHLSNPIVGRGPHVIGAVSAINPIEVMERFDLRPGELDIFIGYAGRDQFNIDAHVDSFLWLAHARGVQVHTVFDPRGKHDIETGLRLFPMGISWLAERLAPYSPPLAFSRP